ncbi:unnamed protein product [Nesidiocoris tenuis]|uniref:Uncharacterized protein n=1 Tax=Nesidiocoris tenuis TaxID=355587 RepID=A0A6H5HBQ5_9HEMI|nr:unnamed protein product [Nesidiocoris tenuis]
MAGIGGRLFLNGPVLEYFWTKQHSSSRGANRTSFECAPPSARASFSAADQSRPIAFGSQLDAQSLAKDAQISEQDIKALEQQLLTSPLLETDVEFDDGGCIRMEKLVDSKQLAIKFAIGDSEVVNKKFDLQRDDTVCGAVPGSLSFLKFCFNQAMDLANDGTVTACSAVDLRVGSAVGAVLQFSLEVFRVGRFLYATDVVRNGEDDNVHRQNHSDWCIFLYDRYFRLIFSCLL